MDHIHRIAYVSKHLVRGDKTVLAHRLGLQLRQVSDFFSGRKPLNERYLGLLHAAEQLIADRRTALNNGPLGPLPTPTTEEVTV